MSRRILSKISSIRRKSPSQKLLGVEKLESRRLLAGDVMHNHVRPADVNNDGQVDVRDAMLAVDRLRMGRRDDSRREAFFDVNDDGKFNIVDPLAAIDRLRQTHRGPEPTRGDATRSLDGTDNNRLASEWGSAGAAFLRLVAPEYSDGADEPAGGERPNAREISNQVFAQDGLTPNSLGLSDLFWQWGQFLDHDIDLTETLDPEQAMNIPVPEGDSWFDPLGTGEMQIELYRSKYDPTTGASAGSPREQLNSISAFIDGSNVYGSDEIRANALRTFEGGRLKTSEGDLLPWNSDGLENAGGAADSLFLAGDIRANEQAGLIAMHTIWLREHNRIADRIAADNPQLDDEMVFQRARSMVIAEMQAITFKEFLPALLGDNAIRDYRGYDVHVNPGITNLFATAAFRFGHSMLSPQLLRLDADGEVADEGNLALQSAFFRPDEIADHGVDSLLRGMASQTAQEIDARLIDDVRNFLFGPPGAGGFDLAALNIQRGRDHGLPSFNEVRRQLGMETVKSFSDITSDPQVQASLEAAYGDVSQVDAWVGMLAEDHARQAAVGETARFVIADQFERLRDGDRFWYQRVFDGEQLRRINNTTLADILERNTDIRGLQRDVMYASDRPASGPAPQVDAPQVDSPSSSTALDEENRDGPERDTREHEQATRPRRREPASADAETVLVDQVFADLAPNPTDKRLLDDLSLAPLDPSDLDAIFGDESSAA